MASLSQNRSPDAARSFQETEALRPKAHALIPGGAHTYNKGDDQYPERAPGLIERGILAPSFVVSFSHTDAEIDRTVEAVEEALRVYKRALRSGMEHHLPCSRCFDNITQVAPNRKTVILNLIQNLYGPICLFRGDSLQEHSVASLPAPHRGAE